MSTITTILSSDSGATSLTEINTNFANLNTDKTEATTAITAGSALFGGSGGKVNQDNSNFFWDTTNKALRLGNGTTTATVDAHLGAYATKTTVNSFFVPYAGQNLDAGTTSSTDYIVGNDSYTDTTNYLDLGINSSGNTDPLYTAMGAGAGYLYAQTGDLVLGTANTGKVVKIIAAGTLTANVVGTFSSTGFDYKRRVITTTQSATPTINTDIGDIFSITGLAQAITSFTTNLSGTPVPGQMRMIQITDNGTARAITWGASFESTTVLLPTTTVISTMLRVLFQWNTATTKWSCIAVA